MTRRVTSRIHRHGLAMALLALMGCGATPDPESQAAEPSNPPLTSDAPPGSATPSAPNEPEPGALGTSEPPGGPGAPAAAGEDIDASPRNGLPTGFREIAAELQDPARRAATPLSVQRLMNVLPEVTGWTRSRHRGEHLATPVRHATAAARYERDAGLVDVDVVDTAFSQSMLAPYTMFVIPGFEERTDDSFRRAITLLDSPAYEAWNAATGHGEVLMVIDERFLVKGTGRNISSLEVITQLMRRMNLSTLPVRR